MSLLIKARGIKKSYKSKIPFFGRTVDVLEDVNLELYEGEIVGIVGENGSGKSTLMKILTGVLDQDSGVVERNCEIGWCPQETLLYEKLTVRENFVVFGSGYGLEREEILNKMEDLGSEFGFSEYTGFKVEELSGGNKQKVNLSVALIHDPDVLLLDEPYSGFDWNTYLKFWDLSRELVSDGKTIVIISHFVNERDNFDKIYELVDGELVKEEL